MSSTDPFEMLRRFFGVAARPGTYGSIAYVWLGFPLGLLYFIVLVTGFSIGLGLSLLWVGLFVLAAMVLGVWGLANFERALSGWLLGQPLRRQRTSAHSQTVWQWFRGILKDSTTWKGGLFLLLKFPLGVFCWSVSVVAFSISAAFLCAPWGRYSVDLDLGWWSIEDPTGGWLFAVLGLVLLFATLHLHNGMSVLWRLITRGLLDTPDVPAPPGDSVVGTSGLQPA